MQCALCNRILIPDCIVITQIYYCIKKDNGGWSLFSLFREVPLFKGVFFYFQLASMAVLGFYFPPESGEKVTLEITILMSLTFFMNVVSDMQPPSSETPLIGTYFSCIMIMVASSVVSSKLTCEVRI